MHALDYMFRRFTPAAAALVLLAACSAGDGGGDAGEGTAARATTTTAPPALSTSSTTSTEAPTTTTTSTAAALAPVRPGPAQPAVPAAAFTCPAVPERRAPRADRPSYRWTINIDLAAGVVDGRGTMAFTPDVDTDRVVLRLWPNSPRITRSGGRIDASVDGALDAVTTRPDATRIVIGRPVRAGERFETGLVWRLTLPTSATNDRIMRGSDWLRLGSFLPVFAWEPGVGWQEQPPTSGFAEASTSVPADYEVTVTGLTEGQSILATGVQGGDGASWYASAVPEWAMTMGRMTRRSREVDGVRVEVGVEATVQDSPDPYLDKVVRSLQRFSQLYGPYPWPSLTVALTPGLSGGIEYPMHILQGPGTIGRTTSHEVAHMWFYGLVSTNQGRDPWIDEGLATWAEGRYEGTTGSLMGTSIPAEGRGRAGEPMTFWESRQSVYYRSVYVQGAQAAGALAPASADAVDCALRHLVARQAYEVTSPQEVVAAIEAVFPDARAVLARFGIRG